MGKEIRAENVSDLEMDMNEFYNLSLATTVDPNKHCVPQSGLRYGMDSQDSIEQMFPIEGDEGETLAAAICCDDRFNIFAEPQFLYERPKAGLFDKVGTVED